MKPERLDDGAARRRALDVERSCIVRAPAGSGKTELLTQRYLALLATVDEPEEIVAITFTRKAAGEMRARIVEALQMAQGAAPEEAHRLLTWELGRRAAARDVERGWSLGSHPARMRIQTIDSLNAELTRQMPLLSGFGAPLRVNELPQELYDDAARRSLRLLDEGEARDAAAVEDLARHLDNDLPRIHRLLARMLARRDQWLRVLHKGNSREVLEAALRREVDGRLERVRTGLPAELVSELVDVARLAGQVLRGAGVESDLARCADLQKLPPADARAVAGWRGITELLLTKDGGWRRQLNKNQGMPPEEAALKARGMELLRQIADREPLRACLEAVPLLPAPSYSDAQWQVLDALLHLLPLASAQLRLVFAERGEVDFAEVALGALQALGEPEAPTDLALALDYRLRHLLVDEFQDTSVNQFKLLEMLTAGWQPEDGRTLFLVGDPAQSVYRFREAEVGLFLRAWERGVGGVMLEPLQLEANFRARPALVEWCNRHLPAVFPPAPDVASGAVPYALSIARRAAVPGSAVKVHAFIAGPDARAAEARRVLEVIHEARAANPQARIAILARAKTHLAACVTALRAAGLHFQAVEIEALGRQPVVQDLLALSRALSHAGDRTAWLAALRAPWCGLSLAELHELAGSDRDATVPSLMAAADGLAARNPRFGRVREVLLRAMAERGRGTLREQVEHAWLELGGPATLASAAALADAEACLELLEELQEGGVLPSSAELERRLGTLFAQADPEADGRLQLMTVHKAKGLEFDVVIVPGLDAATRSDDPDLLVWLERPRSEDETADLLLAPLDAPGQVRDALYSWVRELRRGQERLEMARVLYVAVTRAREQLHLLGAVATKQEEGRSVAAAPRGGSLLALLWPAVKEEFGQALQPASAAMPASQAAPMELSRIMPSWQAPEPGAEVQWNAGTVLAAEQESLEFDWVGETLRHVGTVVHRLLQRIAADGIENWDAGQRQRTLPVVRQLLLQAGVREEELVSAATEVMQAVDNTLADERGRWLLDGRHEGGHSEYSLSLLRDGRLESGVIDRTFVDEDGTRWIVDYKTSRHSGTDLESFLEQERQRYAPQLERYARLMRGLESRRVKVALYFPLLQRFLPWEPVHGAEP